MTSGPGRPGPRRLVRPGPALVDRPRRGARRGRRRVRSQRRRLVDAAAGDHRAAPPGQGVGTYQGTDRLAGRPIARSAVYLVREGAEAFETADGPDETSWSPPPGRRSRAGPATRPTPSTSCSQSSPTGGPPLRAARVGGQRRALALAMATGRGPRCAAARRAVDRPGPVGRRHRLHHRPPSWPTRAPPPSSPSRTTQARLARPGRPGLPPRDRSGPRLGTPSSFLGAGSATGTTI